MINIERSSALNMAVYYQPKRNACLVKSLGVSACAKLAEKAGEMSGEVIGAVSILVSGSVPNERLLCEETSER